MPNTDPMLTAALASLVPPGILISHRVIAPGDEDRLLPEERIVLPHAALKVLRQSGAARIAARQLLCTLGHGDIALPRSRSGAPIWPPGVVGSLAHDDSVAIAAIGQSNQYSALGIDVEPAVPLPPEIITLVATSAERHRYPPAVTESRVLFVIKEAVYKALNPIDGLFLDFHDIEVDLASHRALTRNGQLIAIAVTTLPRIVAISFR